MDLNHQKELFSTALVASICSQSGCQWQTYAQDHGLDLSISGEQWELNPKIDIQIKSTSDLSIIKEDKGLIKYPLRVKNYKDLIKHTLTPRLLILAFVPNKPELWLTQYNKGITARHSIYWYYLKGMKDTNKNHSVTIDIPLENKFSYTALKELMEKINSTGDLV